MKRGRGKRGKGTKPIPDRNRVRLDLSMPLELTGQHVCNRTHQLIEQDGSCRPVPHDFALRHYFGNPRPNGLLPVLRAVPGKRDNS